MSYIPSREARWISAIALRSKVADSRRPGCQPLTDISVAPDVVDVEVVEPARVQARLVDRVPERVARVPAYDQRAGLGHERAHVPDRAADHDVGALEGDRAPGRG